MQICTKCAMAGIAKSKPSLLLNCCANQIQAKRANKEIAVLEIQHTHTHSLNSMAYSILYVWLYNFFYTYRSYCGAVELSNQTLQNIYYVQTLWIGIRCEATPNNAKTPVKHGAYFPKKKKKKYKLIQNTKPINTAV